MIDTLITSGCSFSEAEEPIYINGNPGNLSAVYGLTWAKQLGNYLEPKRHIDLAFSGQGNDLISRKVIHAVQTALSAEDTSSTLIGIMWSGFDRIAVFDHNAHINSQDQSLCYFSVATRSWVNKTNDKFFVDQFDVEHKMIVTLEHILRTQWFLELHNIKYFMTTFTGGVMPDLDQRAKPEIKYLYDLVDLDNWLPVVGEYEWCRDHSGSPFPYRGDFHPGQQQHKSFLDSIIIPFLQNKGWI